MSYSQTEEAVSVTLMDGQVLTAKFLIGADGLRSTIRQQMLGHDTPQFTGNMAWRAVVPIDRLGRLALSFGRARTAREFRRRRRAR